MGVERVYTSAGVDDLLLEGLDWLPEDTPAADAPHPGPSTAYTEFPSAAPPNQPLLPAQQFFRADTQLGEALGGFMETSAEVSLPTELVEPIHALLFNLADVTLLLLVLHALSTREKLSVVCSRHRC